MPTVGTPITATELTALIIAVDGKDPRWRELCDLRTLKTQQPDHVLEVVLRKRTVDDRAIRGD